MGRRPMDRHQMGGQPVGGRLRRCQLMGGGPEPCNAQVLDGRSRKRAGIVLPAALLLILTATLVGTALLVMARSAILLGAGDRALAESLAVRGPDPNAVEPGSAAALPAGYRLVETPVPGVSWRVWSLVWALDPSRLASELTAVVEAESVSIPAAAPLTGTAPEPIRLLGPDEGCPDPEPSLPLVWTGGDGLDALRALGPVGLEPLLRRADVTVTPGTAFPDSPPPRLIGVQAERVGSGGARGLVVAAGDLELAGEAAVTGLLLVGGDLRIAGDARVTGAVRVAGSVTVESGGGIQGCRGIVAQELAGVTVLVGPFPVPGGRFLGRF